MYSILHYPRLVGDNNNPYFSIKQQYQRIFASNGEELLEEYPVSLFSNIVIVLYNVHEWYSKLNMAIDYFYCFRLIL